MAWSWKGAVSVMGYNVQGDVGPMTLYTTRRGRVVVFDKSPPLTPASYAQLVNRNKWRLIAIAWRSLTPQQRADWELATRSPRLTLTGYNLWVWYNTVGDNATLATIERQSGVTLTPKHG